MRLADWSGRPPDGLPGPDSFAGCPGPPGAVALGRDGAWPGPAPGAHDLSGLPGRVVIGPGDVDADLDGMPDTVSSSTADGLVLFTDLDGDGLADQELVLGPDPGGAAPDEPWWDAVGDLVDAVLGR